MTTRTDQLSVDALVDATPTSRDRYVDLLRACSIAVVVLWHWVFSVTHWRDGSLTMPNPIGEVRLLWLATWLLQVMPVFFFVGGFANYAGWEAARRDGGGLARYLRARLQRLLRPVAVFLAVWLAFELLAHGFVDGYRGVLRYGMVVFVPLWFLAVYAGVVLLTPVTAWLHRRGRELTLVVLGSAIVLADLGRFRGGVEELGWATGALVWLFAHQLGYFYRDGTLARLGRRTHLTLAVAGLLGLVVLTNLGVYPRSMVAVRGEAISNMYPTTACIAALAVFQVGVVMLLRPVATRWLAGRRAWRSVVAVNGVAMTTFVWHMTAYALALFVVERLGGELSSDPDLGWWVQRPLWLGLPAVFLAGMLAVFARFERP